MSKIESPARDARRSAMSVVDAIHERRSVRSYAPKTIDSTVVRRLLDAAVHAPTAVHEEPWRFVVIQDRHLLRQLSDDALRGLERGAHEVRLPGGASHHFTPPDNVFYDAGTLIVICGKALGPFVAADCWLAAENLMLAARAMGLGTCVIGLSVAALNTPEWKAALRIPEDTAAYAPIIVGVPAGETPATGRREPQILSWREGPAE